MAADSEAPQAPKSGLVGGIIAIVAITLAAGGGGLGLAWLANGKFPEPSPAAAPAAPAPTTTAAAASHDAVSALPIVHSIPSILTNLSGGNAPWVRLDLSIVMEKDTPDVEHLAGEISQEIAAHVRTLTMDQIVGSTNFEIIQSDLTEIARTLGAGSVRGLLIRALLVE